MRIIIASTGEYSILVKEKSNLAIDRSFEEAFGDLLKETNWYPKAKKMNSAIKHIITHASICFTILHEKVSNLVVEDLDSKYPILHVDFLSGARGPL